MALPLIIIPVRLVIGASSRLKRAARDALSRLTPSGSSAAEKTIEQAVRNAQKQVKFATVVALTRTAKAVPAEASRAVKESFDSPKPFSSNPSAFFVQPARKETMAAVVGFKDTQARYMRPGIAGGARRTKGFELKLRGLGILPEGWRATPGAGVKLDRHGNIPRRMLNEIFGGLQGKPVKGSRLVIVRPGASDPRVKHLSPGIYRGRGRDLTPLLIFVRQAVYKPRFDFKKVGRDVVNRVFQDEFRRAYEQARRTAR